MVSSEYLLGGFLKRIGSYDPEEFLQSFNARLILQKTVYILKRGFEVDLGYPFNWYLRGPYSPSLAADAYRLTEVYDDVPELEFKDSQLEERFQRFLQFIEPNKKDPEWLEPAASILFVLRRQRRRGKVDPERIFEGMRRKNFRFRREKSEKIWNELVAQGAISLEEGDLA